MMTYDILFYADAITGVLSAIFLFGVLIGFLRTAFGANEEDLRLLSIGICLFSFLAIIECLRIRPVSSWPLDQLIYGRMIGIGFNIACGMAAYCLLRFLWITIPEEDDEGRPIRKDWSWLTAPLYPPWGFLTGWRRMIKDLKQCLGRHRK